MYAKKWRDVKPIFTRITCNGCCQRQFYFTRDLLMVHQVQSPREVEQILIQDSIRNTAGNVFRAVHPRLFGLICEVVLSY